MKDDATLNIGNKIRIARKKANMSIKTLAAISGMSPAAIQKIETDNMVPTIVSLYKISRALNRAISFFIEDENPATHIAFIKKRDREKFYSERSKCYHEYIVGKLENELLEGGIFTAEPGGESGKDLNSHPGEEIIFCLKGRVEVQISDKKFLLKPGDTLHYKSDNPHRWCNIGNSDAQILWIYTQVPS